MAEAVTQEIAREKFERALAVLEAEQKAMRLSKAQRYFLRLYTIFVWGFSSFFITLFIYFIVSTRILSVSQEMHYVLIISFSLGAFLCLACAVVLFFLNIPVIVKFARNKRRFHRLGFSDVSESLWKRYRGMHRGSAIVGKISLGLAIFFLLLSAGGSWAGFRAEGVGTAFAVLGLYLVPCAILVMFYVLQICKAWLEIMTLQWKDATHLKELMLDSRNRAQKAGLERIPVPAEAIQQIAHIENVQIARSRAEAIAESITTPVREFSILLSQQVLKVKAGLEPDARLKVEHALDALMIQPKTAFTEQDTETGGLRQPVNGTELVLIYQMDDAARQLKVLSLESSTRSTVGSTRRA